MIGGTAVYMETPLRDLDLTLWTRESVFEVVSKACAFREAEASHLLWCWFDMVHSPVVVRILEYASLPADLSPSTLGRYNPPAPEAIILRDQLENALWRDAQWYFEPPLNVRWLQWKYLALYFFHYIDDGLRFEVGHAHNQQYQR